MSDVMTAIRSKRPQAQLVGGVRPQARRGRMVPLVVCALVVCALAVPAALPGQADRPLRPGERVRLEGAGVPATPLVGVLHRLESDGLSVRRGPDTLFVRWDAVERVSARRTGKTEVRKAALVGGLTLGTVGAAAALMDQDCNLDHCWGALGPLGGFIIASIPGTLLGGVVGAFMGGFERWVAVPPPPPGPGTAPGARRPKGS